MEKISIFNYESYYLDYLEGNLGEEDTRMLMEFLEKYPECALENEELPVLDEEVLSGFDKDSLYILDTTEAVGKKNYNDFLIADLEGQLNNEKSSELAAFLAKNDLFEEQELVNALRLEADESLKYTDKAGLKKEGGLVILPYWRVAAAAAAIFAFVYWLPIDNGQDYNMPQFAYNGKTFTTNAGIDPVQIIEDVSNGVESVSEAIWSSSEVDTKQNGERFGKGTPERTEPITARLEQRRVAPLSASVVGKELAPITNYVYSAELSEKKQEDLAVVDFADMNNPIEPITKAISERTKTPVEFRTSKASKNKQGGFLLKIGKFEVSRKTHK